MGSRSDWIFGDADQRTWTQIQKGGKRRSFQNPLRQNYAHVMAVKELLGIDKNVLHNFVVFAGSAEPKTAMPENVAWGLQALGSLIAERRQLVLSDAQVNDCILKLQGRALENTRATRKLHLQNLEKKAAAKAISPSPKQAVSAASTSCQRCGSEMVKRTNRKTGDTFWGCSGFPKCRDTRKSA